MKQFLTNFSLGWYVGQVVEIDGNETEFLNELLNRIIDDASYELDEAALAEESACAERDLRAGLREGRTSVGAFCYVSGIEESELFDFCRANLVRTALENATIHAIADSEGITVSPKDVEAYKRDYRDQYARALLSEPDFGDSELEEAILAKKVLGFLKSNNTSRRKN